MAKINKKFQDEISSQSNLYTLTETTESSQSTNYYLTRKAKITQQGTPLNAQTFNELIEEINGAFDNSMEKQADNYDITMDPETPQIIVDVTKKNLIKRLPVNSSRRIKIVNAGESNFDESKVYLLEIPYMASEVDKTGYMTFEVDGQATYIDEGYVNLPATLNNEVLTDVRFLLYFASNGWQLSYISGTKSSLNDVPNI